MDLDEFFLNLKYNFIIDLLSYTSTFFTMSHGVVPAHTEVPWYPSQTTRRRVLWFDKRPEDETRHEAPEIRGKSHGLLKEFMTNLIARVNFNKE